MPAAVPGGLFSSGSALAFCSLGVGCLPLRGTLHRSRTISGGGFRYCNVPSPRPLSAPAPRTLQPPGQCPCASVSRQGACCTPDSGWTPTAAAREWNPPQSRRVHHQGTHDGTCPLPGRGHAGAGSPALGMDARMLHCLLSCQPATCLPATATALALRALSSDNSLAFNPPPRQQGLDCILPKAYCNQLATPSPHPYLGQHHCRWPRQRRGDAARAHTVDSRCSIR